MKLTFPTALAVHVKVTPSDIPNFIMFLDWHGFMPFKVSHDEILICKPFALEDKDEWEHNADRSGPSQYAGQGDNR